VFLGGCEGGSAAKARHYLPLLSLPSECDRRRKGLRGASTIQPAPTGSVTTKPRRVITWNDRIEECTRYA